MKKSRVFRTTHAAVLLAASSACVGACSFANDDVGMSGNAITGGTACSGVILEAIRTYKPTTRTDATVTFSAGSLTFAVPASIPVTSGQSGDGKVKFTFSNGGGTPIACVYRGNGTNAYDFRKCRAGDPVVPDPDDDDSLTDDGPSDPMPVAGTTVTADSFKLRLHRGLKDAGTTRVSLHLGGPVVDDGDACTTDACNDVDGVTHTPINLDDGNHCTIDTCDRVTGPAHTEITSFDLPPLAPIPNNHPFPNGKGAHATYSTAGGSLDTSSAFFQSLGTNGRACVTCHDPGNAWSIDSSTVRARFDASCGLDPLFRPVDGSNSPNADVSTVEARRAAYSVLLNKGLIRIELPVPPTAATDPAGYTITAVDDPYGNDTAGLTKISVFRRPLPSTNLKFLNRVMWDMREPDLGAQAINATIRHAEGVAPSSAAISSIVAFETGLFTTQVHSSAAGSTSNGANGDPFFLSGVPFELNGNTILQTQTAPFPNLVNLLHPVDVNAMKVFDGWSATGNAAQEQIARGQVLYNTKPLRIFRVQTGPTSSVTIAGTCTSCHNAINAGGFTAPNGFQTGPSNVGPNGGFFDVLTSAVQFRTADLPLYTVRQNAAPNRIVRTTDLGNALTTGKFTDVDRFKVPNLRGLAGRAPYFHNGLAPTLRAVVDHYNTVMFMGMTESEKVDMTAFLETL